MREQMAEVVRILTERRRALGMTGPEVGRRMSPRREMCMAVNISRWENGANLPTWEMLELWAHALGMMVSLRVVPGKPGGDSR